MSIIERSRLHEGVAVGIVAVQPRADYVLRLKFDDGFERDLDFGPFLRASSNPQINAYLDVQKFQSFSLNDGELVWGDFELCFPVADLYDGKI